MPFIISFLNETIIRTSLLFCFSNLEQLSIPVIFLTIVVVLVLQKRKLLASVRRWQWFNLIRFWSLPPLTVNGLKFIIKEFVFSQQAKFGFWFAPIDNLLIAFLIWAFITTDITRFLSLPVSALVLYVVTLSSLSIYVIRLVRRFSRYCYSLLVAEKAAAHLIFHSVSFCLLLVPILIYTRLFDFYSISMFQHETLLSVYHFLVFFSWVVVILLAEISLTSSELVKAKLELVNGGRFIFTLVEEAPNIIRFTSNNKQSKNFSEPGLGFGYTPNEENSDESEWWFFKMIKTFRQWFRRVTLGSPAKRFGLTNQQPIITRQKYNHQTILSNSNVTAPNSTAVDEFEIERLANEKKNTAFFIALLNLKEKGQPNIKISSVSANTQEKLNNLAKTNEINRASILKEQSIFFESQIKQQEAVKNLWKKPKPIEEFIYPSRPVEELISNPSPVESSGRSTITQSRTTGGSGKLFAPFSPVSSFRLQKGGPRANPPVNSLHDEQPSTDESSPWSVPPLSPTASSEPFITPRTSSPRVQHFFPDDESPLAGPVTPELASPRISSAQSEPKKRFFLSRIFFSIVEEEKLNKISKEEIKTNNFKTDKIFENTSKGCFDFSNSTAFHDKYSSSANKPDNSECESPGEHSNTDFKENYEWIEQNSKESDKTETPSFINNLWTTSTDSFQAGFKFGFNSLLANRVPTKDLFPLLNMMLNPGKYSFRERLYVWYSTGRLIIYTILFLIGFADQPPEYKYFFNLEQTCVIARNAKELYQLRIIQALDEIQPPKRLYEFIHFDKSKYEYFLSYSKDKDLYFSTIEKSKFFEFLYSATSSVSKICDFVNDPVHVLQVLALIYSPDVLMSPLVVGYIVYQNYLPFECIITLPTFCFENFFITDSIQPQFFIADCTLAQLGCIYICVFAVCFITLIGWIVLKKVWQFVRTWT